jgi:uncharacterized membrane protein YfcA
MASHEIGIAQPSKMMRYRRLFQRKTRGEIADADLVLRAHQGGKNRKPMRIGERLEEQGVIGEIEVDDFRRRATTRYRHSSILSLISTFVNAKDVQDEIAAGPAKRGAMGTWVVLFAAAIFGGALNAVAGGGSFLTFPALLFMGVPPISANTTSTAALLPGVFASITGYREDFPKATTFVLWLSVASLVGGLAGAVFLLRTPEEAFRRLIPYLLGIATLTFILSKRLSEWMGRAEHHITAPSTRALVGVSFAQLIISIYGGYFGGGMGIMMLAVLTLLGMTHIHRMNALKNSLGALINGVAVVAFVIAGAVRWAPAAVMIVGGMSGGYLGAATARKVDPKRVRVLVIVIAWAMTVYFFVRTYIKL